MPIIQVQRVGCLATSNIINAALQVIYYTLLISDEDDFTEVKKEVASLAARWEDLGGSLGIRPSTMDTIKSAHAMFPNQCLAKTLTEWLNKNYKVRRRKG